MKQSISFVSSTKENVEIMLGAISSKKNPSTKDNTGHLGSTETYSMVHFHVSKMSSFLKWQNISETVWNRNKTFWAISVIYKK